jgi:predicted DNA-binding ribbon-helix-helix protein
VFVLGKQTVTSIRVDEDLWRDAKIYAIRKETTLTELIEKLLRDELKSSRKES